MSRSAGSTDEVAEMVNLAPFCEEFSRYCECYLFIFFLLPISLNDLLTTQNIQEIIKKTKITNRQLW